ncbi:putative asparagine-rich zinc finger protein AZF1 [Amylocarpus encephaloides]|uniref:Asparagine-rich zinc finger protein AZF1 n=1 Tax=Amylocarpus encephaloides TaxID=45428 RepID=A0A9P7YGV7_9HELO|nr:putative asparagine-rich zinc finger protein AZF1 [Amylocarpus encephaloides]
MIGSQQHIQLQNPFGFSPFPGSNSASQVSNFNAKYIQQKRPLPPIVQSQNEKTQNHSPRITRPGFIEEHHEKHPRIKLESNWVTLPGAGSLSPTFSSPITKTIGVAEPVRGAGEIDFGTEVDTLMKAIQAKSKGTLPQTPTIKQSRTVVGVSLTPHPHPSSQKSHDSTSTLKLTHEDAQEETTTSSKHRKKQFTCMIETCSKSFSQKTHLNIHERMHTGAKPYSCEEPGCGRSFSQLGNLKTHGRRHTGERPYPCNQCGRRFAQRGNLRAHRGVHQEAKPYLCRLDRCGRQFTQLGNLKSHQNKFHVATIRTLTAKFASTDGDSIRSKDKELWEYFANLYKNSNKGIKGRGKEQKIGDSPMALTSPNTSLGRGRLVMNNGMVGPQLSGRGDDSRYDVFDADDESHSGRSGSGGPSSVSTGYDDAPSDGFDDHDRGASLAFGDRIC